MKMIVCGLGLVLAAAPALAQDSNASAGSDAKVILKTTKTMVDKPLAFPSSGTPELIMLVLTMQPNGRSSLHKHPGNLASGYVIEGVIEVRSEGEVLKVNTGEAFVEPTGDDAVQLWNTNTGVSKLLISVVGTTGTAISAPVK